MVQSPTPLFVDHEHAKIRIFVEANILRVNRPKLIRTVIEHGAELCLQPAEAHIILVDGQTKEGRKFVGDWSSDTGKVLLDCSWVQKSLNAGHALLVDEEWGGCADLTRANFAGEGDEDEDEEDEDDDEVEEIEVLRDVQALPTPCATPLRPVPPPALTSRLVACNEPAFVPFDSSGASRHGTTISPRTAPSQLRRDSELPSTPRPMHLLTTEYEQFSVTSEADHMQAQSTSSVPSQNGPHPPVFSSLSTSPKSVSSYSPTQLQQDRMANFQHAYPPQLHATTPSSQFQGTLTPLSHTTRLQTGQTDVSSAHTLQTQQVFSASSPSTAGLPSTYSVIESSPSPSPEQNHVSSPSPHHSIQQSITIPSQVQYASQLSGTNSEFNNQQEPPMTPPALPAEQNLQVTQSSPPITAFNFANPGLPPVNFELLKNREVLSLLAYFTSPDSSATKSTVGASDWPVQQNLGPSLNTGVYRPMTQEPPPAPAVDQCDHVREGFSSQIISPSTDCAYISSAKLVGDSSAALPLKNRKRAANFDSTDSRRVRDESPVPQILWRASKSKRRPSTQDASSSSASHSCSQVNFEDPPPHGIFVDDWGNSLTFYLQVDMRNRMNVLRLIKSNGGKIITDILLARFVILAPQGTSYEKLLNDTIVADKLPLAAAFVDACINAGHLVHEEDHILDRLVHLKGGSFKSSSKKPPFPFKARRRRPVPPKSLPNRNRSTRSPTPPTKIIKTSQGKNTYTDDDHEYFIRYTRWAIRGDPNVTTYALTQQLAAKAPTHSSASWQSFVTHHRTTVKDIRAEVQKEKHEEPDHYDLMQRSDSSRHGLYDGVYGSFGEIKIEDQGFKADLAEITTYFASVDDSSQRSDEDMWNELAQKHHCRTSSSWLRFYESHKEAVDASLSTMLAAMSACGEDES